MKFYSDSHLFETKRIVFFFGSENDLGVAVSVPEDLFPVCMSLMLS
jgi:hypothetical protein